jgi:tetraacyldisaccharide 4'-kinase
MSTDRCMAMQSGPALVTRLWAGAGPGWRLARALLAPATALYGGGVALRNAAYGAGVLPVHRVPARIVSVGNVRVGGTGKTPVTRWLAQAARARGTSVAIVSRGYGGRTRAPHVVGDGTAPLSDVAASGDEAMMLARTSGVPVVAGRDRVAAAALAVERFGVALLLCDDAFQHRRLARDLDVVLVDAAAEESRGRLLPAGPLREPLAALARADVVLVCEREGTPASSWQPPVPVMRRVRLGAVALVMPGAGGWEEDALALLAGRRVLAVSGVARPAPIYATLREWGAELVQVLEYPDHHRYDTGSWQEIARAAADVDLVVTTEKDLVKLEQLPFARGKLVALRLGVTVDDPEDLIARVVGVPATAGALAERS